MSSYRRFGVSRSADARLRFAAKLLLAQSTMSEAFILTPTKAAGDDFVRTYMVGPEAGAGLAGPHRTTPLQLAIQIGAPRLAASGKAPVGGLALEALATRAAHLAGAAAELEYFGPVAQTVGFGRALGRTIAELRSEAAPPDSLRGLGRSGPDLARLLARYESGLEESALADPASVFDAATDVIENGESAIQSGVPLLLIDVWGRSTTELRFLSAMIRLLDWAVVVAPPDAGPALDHLAGELGTSPESIHEDSTSNSLNKIRQYMFEADAPTAAPADSSLEFFSATDEGRESVEIARHIQIAGSGGVRFDRIAILLRNPDTYQTLVEDALRRAGVPAHYARGSIRPNPSGRAFLSLIACAAERYSASRFSEYLSLAQVPTMTGEESDTWVCGQAELFESEAIAPLPSPENPAVPDTGPLANDNPVQDGSLAVPFDWERLLVDAAVIGGRDRWARRLGGLMAEYETQATEVGSEDEARREYLDRQKERLGNLGRFALPVIESLAALPASASWKEWLNKLESLAAQTLRQPAHVLSVLAELRAMGDVGPVSLDEVQRVLTDRLSVLRDEPVERRYGKVFVGTIPEAAGRAFDMVFIPGLAEGVFPRKSLEDPLLLDEFRNLSGLGLPGQRDRIRDERLLLHIAVGAARKKLFVSYPRMSVAQGRGRVPSFYALEILRAAEGRIPDLGQLELRATEASMSRLGWPSPLDVRRAVDDAEYDLATIGALMQQRSGESQPDGMGHYLLESNASLRRSLRTRARRWRNFWSEADGILAPDSETLALLAEQRTRARSYSATALQQFAACPYRFLLHTIHRLRPREEAVAIEQLDPLTRGALFHTILFRTLTQLRESGLLPVSAANQEEARAIADRILDTAAEEYREQLAPAIDRIWSTGIEDIRTDLRGWLLQQVEATENAPGWTPRYFELAFGLVPGEERDPSSRDEEAVVFGNVRLRGSIDLVEEHKPDGLLRIVDHKTGRAPNQRLGPTGAGEVLQPMLYAVAAEAILNQPVALSGLSFCTQRGDFRRLEVEVNDQTREAAEKAVRLIDQSIADGFFPAAPRKDACTYCDYRIVCGPYEELRTSRKRVTDKTRAWVARLTELRQIP